MGVPCLLEGQRLISKDRHRPWRADWQTAFPTRLSTHVSHNSLSTSLVRFFALVRDSLQVGLSVLQLCSTKDRPWWWHMLSDCSTTELHPTRFSPFGLSLFRKSIVLWWRQYPRQRAEPPLWNDSFSPWYHTDTSVHTWPWLVWFSLYYLLLQGSVPPKNYERQEISIWLRPVYPVFLI